MPNVVYVGHSTDGECLLSTPALAAHVIGLVLKSTAPDASWMPAFVAMTEANPLPAVDAATRVYEREPTDAHLGAIGVASAEWNFGPGFDDRFRGPNVEHAVIERGQHFPWFENPSAVRDALQSFAGRLTVST